MFDPIRELIAQHRIPQALAEAAKLDLQPGRRSQLLNFRRRWNQLTEESINNTREARLLKIEENDVIVDFMRWLDALEYSGGEDEAVPSPLPPHAGAPATAQTTTATSSGEGFSNKNRLMPILLGLLGLIIVSVVGYILATDKESSVLPPEVVVKEQPAGQPADTPPPNTPAPDKPEPDKPADTPTPADPKPRGSRPDKPASLATDLVAVPARIDPSVLAPANVMKMDTARLINPGVLFTNISLMTNGSQVDLAVAVYKANKSPTKFDAKLTNNLSGYLQREIKPMKVSDDVLTSTFHNLEGRERLTLRGFMTDKRLKANRARYILTADVRNIDSQGKGYLRLMLYDVARGKGFTRRKSIDIGTSTRLKEKDLAYAARDYLKEMKDRGLFK